jgi:acetyl-CoA carboxylase biotin carboxylase subunit
MIQRLLIANRGEIARRIMRTCRQMGIATVAAYSDADASAAHVAESDFKELLGPAPATQSYLNIAKVIDAARRSGADAIHPGYGFLSENAAFAEACAQAGITFVGPPADAMRKMSSKTASRSTMAAAGVPVVPGETPKSQSLADIRAAITAVGLPVLLKAAAGGGGKGMRIIRTDAEIDDAIAAAKSEAERAFGNGAVYVERLIERARHIEVQILGDGRGNVLHLFERDCTLQRRHQKVIEEAPAPRLSAAVRDRLTSAGVAAGRAVGYVNAGTVEFLLEGDGDDARFYFLEMNTRLQVEHPITEAITGIDLVQAQLLIASGQPLPFRQEDLRRTGHAVECRVYAEDARRLLPQAGRILLYREPSGDGVRVDSGVVAGQTVTVHYDPLLAKVITYAETRDEALSRMRRALSEYDVLGVRHNISFLLALLNRSEVTDNRAHTRFIEEHLTELAAPVTQELTETAVAMAAFAAAQVNEPARTDEQGDDVIDLDPWSLLGPVIW